MTQSRLQLLAPPGGKPGESGFKLTGAARDGDGLCRIWLRRKRAWDRYLDPRSKRGAWDLRCYTHDDSAFAVVEELDLATLDTLGERYDLSAPASELLAMKPNGDPLHDRVLQWLRRASGVETSTASSSAPLDIDAVGDAWDEIEEVARRASASLPAVQPEDA